MFGIGKKPIVVFAVILGILVWNTSWCCGHTMFPHSHDSDTLEGQVCDQHVHLPGQHSESVPGQNGHQICRKAGSHQFKPSSTPSVPQSTTVDNFLIAVADHSYQQLDSSLTLELHRHRIEMRWGGKLLSGYGRVLLTEHWLS